MTRTITLVKNAEVELTGRHAQVASKIKGTMEVAQLRKSCRTLKPKRFRAIVRQLVAVKAVKLAKQ
jgi:hypothetical protein